MNRRSFLFLSATFAAGCATAPGGAGLGNGSRERTVNAGPAGQYLKDGVYDRYCDLGFFIVRRGAAIFAISSICTHRKCTLEAEDDRTFYCPCHGSTFDPDGHVTEGPARRNLPVLVLSTDDKGNVLVTIPAG